MRKIYFSSYIVIGKTQVSKHWPLLGFRIGTHLIIVINEVLFMWLL